MSADTRSGPLARKALMIIAVFLAIIVVFLIVNYLHFQWVPVSVILWACIADLAITLVATAPALYFFVWRRQVLTEFELILTGLLASTVVVLYAVMGPTVIDRSLSIYIVQKLDQRGGEVSVDAIPDIFVDEYMPEFRLVDVRLTEQLSSGTAELDGDCLVLTSKGRLLARFADGYRRHMLPRKRVLRDTVTDELTRPFDNAPQRVDVACQRSSD